MSILRDQQFLCCGNTVACNYKNKVDTALYSAPTPSVFYGNNFNCKSNHNNGGTISIVIT